VCDQSFHPAIDDGLLQTARNLLFMGRR